MLKVFQSPLPRTIACLTVGIGIRYAKISQHDGLTSLKKWNEKDLLTIQVADFQPPKQLDHKFEANLGKQDLPKIVISSMPVLQFPSNLKRQHPKKGRQSSPNFINFQGVFARGGNLPNLEKSMGNPIIQRNQGHLGRAMHFSDSGRSLLRPRVKHQRPRARDRRGRMSPQLKTQPMLLGTMAGYFGTCSLWVCVFF